MNSPIDVALDKVTWTATGNEPGADPDMRYATHEGVFNFAGMSIRCYRLNDGQAVFDADDFEKVFGEFMNAAASIVQPKASDEPVEVSNG